ncbi:MAG: polysaccharide biosynthesis C-terminal domain-containing protein [Flavobacteriales bacterium]|nr:polysaccharide biosynthesis C-terminal domain-containing protein [Flavobacteriales bacterium]
MSFIKNSSLYVIFSMAQKAIPLILIHFLTVEISQESMGGLSLFNTFSTFASAFISMSLLSFLMKIYYHEPKEKLAKLVSGSFVVFLIITIALMLLLYLVRINFGNALRLPAIYDFLLPFSVFISQIPNMNMYILRNEEKVKTFGYLSVGFALTEFCLSLFFLIGLEMDWESRVYSVVFTNLVFGMIHLVILYKNGFITWKLDQSLMKKAIIHSLPFIPSTLALSFLDLSDRYLIDYFLGSDILGLYEVGYKFGSIMMIVGNALSMAFIPFLYKLIAKKDHDKTLMVQFIYIYHFVLIIASIASFIGVWILYQINFVGENFTHSLVYVPIIAVAYLFQSYFQLHSQIINNTSKAKVIAYISVLGSIINIAINVIFLKKYGIMVACYSTLISFLIMWLLNWYFSGKYFRLPWFSKKVLKLNVEELKALVR